MSLTLVYDPTVVFDPAPLVDAFPLVLPDPATWPHAVALVAAPSGWQTRITMPAAGYVVVRTRWDGIDVLPGPVRAADILALPSPDPPASAQAARLDAVSTILAVPPPPLAMLQSDIGVLRTYLGLGSPTAAQAEAALSSLIRVVWATAFLAATA